MTYHVYFTLGSPKTIQAKDVETKDDLVTFRDDKGQKVAVFKTKDVWRIESAGHVQG
jgi:hypothetical protein